MKNVYYCLNNIIINDFRDVKTTYQEKEKYIVFDYFILDLENKTIKLYDKSIMDSFIDNLNCINKIEIKNDKQTDNKIIYLSLDNSKTAIIVINKFNEIIFYENDNIYKIENDFLYYNKKLSVIKLPNVVEIGNDFLVNNQMIKSLNFPKLMKVGDNFLYYNDSLKEINFPLLESVGDLFFPSLKELSKIILPNLKIAGSGFLFSNLFLKVVDLPELIYVGDDFLYYSRKHNKTLKNKINKIINRSRKEQQKVLKLEKKKNGR